MIFFIFLFCCAKFLYFTAHPQLEYDNRLKSTQNFKAGSSIVILVNVSGIPTPTIKWLLNEKEIETSYSLNIETTEKFSRVTIKNADTKDGGVYTIVAENSVGKAAADFEILVKGNKNFELNCICINISLLSLTLLYSYHFQVHEYSSNNS